MVLKVEKVFYPVLEFRDEKRTFADVEGGNVDLFLLAKHVRALQRKKKLSYIYENDNETVHTHAHTQ
jgi:hypothetical protein